MEMYYMMLTMCTDAMMRCTVLYDFDPFAYLHHAAKN
jgi:hypothetical protein